MRINVIPGKIIFEGSLDEQTSAAELEAALKKVAATVNSGPIALDFSKVARSNSSGILTWLRFLKSSNTTFKYLNVPSWLVSQFNMITGHFVNGSFVESFQAPFYAPKTQASKNLTLTIRKDVPLQQSYENFKVENRIVDGVEYEMDFDPSDYFHFISENFEQFGKGQ